jgi:hypothetical protein
MAALVRRLTSCLFAGWSPPFWFVKAETGRSTFSIRIVP